MKRFVKFSDFLEEKRSPYKKATLLKYKRKWDEGEKVPFGVENSLKAMGLIPRADGEFRVSDEYKDLDGKIKSMIRVKPKDTPEKKKAIKESFDETINDAEIEFSTKDKDGKVVEIKEIEGTGMAGEPMVFSYIFHDGHLTSKEKLKPHLSPTVYKEICEYLNDIADNNEASAISFVR